MSLPPMCPEHPRRISFPALIAGTERGAESMRLTRCGRCLRWLWPNPPTSKKEQP